MLPDTLTALLIASCVSVVYKMIRKGPCKGADIFEDIPFPTSFSFPLFLMWPSCMGGDVIWMEDGLSPKAHVLKISSPGGGALLGDSGDFRR